MVKSSDLYNSIFGSVLHIVGLCSSGARGCSKSSEWHSRWRHMASWTDLACGLLMWSVLEGTEHLSVLGKFLLNFRQGWINSYILAVFCTFQVLFDSYIS